VKAEERVSELSVVAAARGPPPPFIDQGEAVYSRAAGLYVRCGGVAHSADDSMTVLANLAPGRHRGGSCACPGAASRVVVLKFSFDRRLYTSSRVRLTGDRKLHSDMRGDVLSACVLSVLGMALQCLNSWQSARHGRTGPEVAEVMEEMCSAGLTSRHRPRRALDW
jgi:hypothetical protein